MNWIDLSEMKAPLNLPSGWEFRLRTEPLNDDEIAACGDRLLLTMSSKEIKPGEITAVRDHVNLSGKNPLRGHNNDQLGVRFPDMSHPYAIPDGFKGDRVVIRAGQNEKYPYDAIEASGIVYQTILAKHQLKTVYALIYGDGVKTDDIIKTITGE